MSGRLNTARIKSPPYGSISIPGSTACAVPLSHHIGPKTPRRQPQSRSHPPLPTHPVESSAAFPTNCSGISPENAVLNGKKRNNSIYTPTSTPASSAKKSRPGPSPGSMSRYDSSLGLLTRKFTNLIQASINGAIDLNEAASQLNVQKRRIYDITNVLEGVGLIEKRSKNVIAWRGAESRCPSGMLGKDLETVKEEIDRLYEEDNMLNRWISKLHSIVHPDELYCTPDDVLMATTPREQLSNVQNLYQNGPVDYNTCIAIRGPAGTILEIPDPSEGRVNGDARYEMLICSSPGMKLGAPGGAAGQEQHIDEVPSLQRGGKPPRRPSQTAPLHPTVTTENGASLQKLTARKVDTIDVFLLPNYVDTKTELLKLKGSPIILKPKNIPPDDISTFIYSLHDDEGATDLFFE